MAGRLNWQNGIIILLLSILLLPAISAWAADGRPRVEITDLAGRQVRVPARIKKVVPLGGALRFMVYMRSLDLVAGMEKIERKWTSPGRLYGLTTLAAAKKLPVIGEGGPGKLPDFEQIISVWPDMILAVGLAARQVETIQAKTGIPVVVLSYGTPGALKIDQVRKSMKLLGRLLGREKRAAALVNYMDRQFADLAARSAGVAPDEGARAYAGALSFKGKQGITSTEPGHAPLAWAGGRNVVDGIGKTGHVFVDPEQLLAWDPDVIFLDAGSLDVVEDDFSKKPGFYNKLKAVKSGNVFLTMPYNYYHTNIEIALADAFFMGKVLYPRRYRDIDAAAKADEIFNFFIARKAYGRLVKEFHGFSRVRFGAQGLEFN